MNDTRQKMVIAEIERDRSREFAWTSSLKPKLKKLISFLS